ncbi:hypothetical protein BIV57_14300 [Mangrovactinospora gilvigrisea]|uniref:Uncharacterized protein n=1 Tax=Mangrovactinospora gilvigrisea TaxID=1428644 RepID=A0A1J7BDS5_9ACTN|nr:hypothetical protein BIV57_14300 [Mangrovactinospora gilvigrisea]
MWSHVGKSFGDAQVWYVARVDNRAPTLASVALNVRALDASRAIVGSSQVTLPNVPGQSNFDYFGYLGGPPSDTNLTGTPVKIDVSEAHNAFGQAGAVEMPMLRTSEITLALGSEDTNTNAPYSYDLTAKVTNDISREVDGGVTQQVVLYDSAGHVVGGDTGTSDNAPDSLPTGMSYREQWTGIPALHHAVRAVYSVWVG